MSNGLLLLIILPVVFALVVGLPLYLLSQRRQQKEREEAIDRMMGMPLTELQTQIISVDLEVRPFRDLLLSPTAAQWMELLLLRTFEEPDFAKNYGFLLDKYASILKQLVGRLEPWSDTWKSTGEEMITEVRLEATDTQWIEHFTGFDETVNWLATLASQQSRLAARVKDFQVPRWNDGILVARCETSVNGFDRRHILTTRLHGASLANEINRITQPLKQRSEEVSALSARDLAQHHHAVK